ncbi:MAG TPA: DUF6510 family protein [Ktedonobacterales bacterium]|jgi:ribosomal protein S27E
MEETKLDGNAAGGVLREIFSFERTTAQATCDGCGTTGAVAVLAVYMSNMGAVVRCPACDNALIRVARGSKGCYWLDLRGVHVLQITAEA